MKTSLPLAIALLLTTPVLAGCLGLGGDEVDEAIEPGAGAAEASPETGISIPAPTWTIGQWWAWESPQIGTYTYVVTGEQGGDWIVDTDNEDTAFFDAQSDISFLGPVRKSDLAGSQGDTRVRFFDWPLELGKTWTTTWDGVQRTIEVVAIDEEKAQLEARQDGRLAVTYEYRVASEGIGNTAFLDASGEATFDVRFMRAGENFTGTPVRWNLETLVEQAGTIGPTLDSWGGQFEIAEGTTDLHLTMNATCPSGALSFGLSPAEDLFAETADEGWSVRERCPHDVAVQGPIVEAPSPGQWSAGFQATSPQEEGSYDITLLARTLQSVTIG